jgi:hypothetical protein
MIPHGTDRPVYGFRPGTGKTAPGEDVSVLTRPQDRPAGEDEEVLLCRRCRNVVTAPAEKIDVNGAHCHGFTNPHGLFFELGCFRHAPGCAYSSDASWEFTWFPGYSWRIAVCRACMGHLGWLFTSDSRRFTGLILSELVAGPSERRLS